MVPISKSIWPLILFVYANFYFAAITRFNSSFCFSKIFSRERSSSPPPNFAPSFCALCLNVCDFLPKTWNLRRKEGKSAPTREKGYRNARRRFCTPKFKIILPLQQRRPPPAAETGRSCWGSGQQDARAAQGTMRMLGAATRKTRRAFQIFFHPLSLMVASACLCSNCTNSCSSGCKGSRSGYTSTSRICCFCAGQLCSARWYCSSARCGMGDDHI